MLPTLLAALLVFSLRVCDVSMGTLRTLFMVRGRRYTAAGIGVVETLIYLTAIGSVLTGEMTWGKMVGYAAGFAVGTILGVTVEGWIACGWVIMRVISREKPFDLIEKLRAENFGVTVVRGEGRDGELPILFVVAPRKRGRAALRIVQHADPNAFVTVDPIHQAIGGHLPTLPNAGVIGGARKFGNWLRPAAAAVSFAEALPEADPVPATAPPAVPAPVRHAPHPSRMAPRRVRREASDAAPASRGV